MHQHTTDQDLKTLKDTALKLLEPHLLKCTNGRTGRFPVGEICSPQTATGMMVRLNSPWAPGHFCGVSIVIVVVVVLLFGSRAGTHQIRDQSHALEDRNDSNNSLEVHTPNSFIHLLYNSPHMDIVDMHNVIVTPSESVLWEKTVEASTTYLPAQPDGSLLYQLPKGGWRPVLGLSTFPTDWDIGHRV